MAKCLVIKVDTTLYSFTESFNITFNSKSIEILIRDNEEGISLKALCAELLALSAPYTISEVAFFNSGSLSIATLKFIDVTNDKHYTILTEKISATDNVHTLHLRFTHS